MVWFKNLRIGVKLSAGFGLALALMGVVWFAGFNGANALASNIKSLKYDVINGLEAAQAIDSKFQDSRRMRYVIAAEKDKNENLKNLELLTKTMAGLEDGMAEYEKTITAKEDRDNFDALKAAIVDYKSIDAEFRKSIEASKDKEAAEQLAKMKQTVNDSVAPAFAKVLKYNSENGEKVAKKAFAAVDNVKRTSTVVIIVAVLLSIGFCVFLTHLVVATVQILGQRMKSLNEKCLTNLMNAMGAVKDGDLTVSVRPETEAIPNPSRDELGQMCSAFNEILGRVQQTVESYNTTRDSLAQMVRELQNSASAVAATSQQLSSSATDTTELTTSIAESTQQVATAIEEASRSSQQIAKGSEQLAITATDAAAAMEKLHGAISQVKSGSDVQAAAADESSGNVKSGIAAVEATVTSMDRIESQVQKSADAVKDLGEKGQQIGEIVQTIEDIAQQTNLLALNAAIEAARAGEQGKGFAVVADEVRKLAERSALATQEIGTLISSVRDGVELAVKAMDASTGEVQEGATKSKEAGVALRQIIAATEKVMTATDANRIAVEEMVKGAEQVSLTITTAASVSEENAASAEQLSAGTQEVYASTESVSASVSEASASVEAVSDAARELSEMAESLNQIVNRFKVESTERSDHSYYRIAA